MIKPSVGRVLWFFRDANQDQPMAAQISYVWSDRLVNIGYLDPNGNARAETSVQLVQDGDSVFGPCRYCRWMPYQQGQAAKAEALEAQLNAKDAE